MTNEIGMLKAGLNQVERSSPTAKAGKADASQEEKLNPQQAAEQAEKEASPSDVAEEVVSGLTELVHELHRELRFSIDRDSGETVIKVIDQQTDEVVRQIPSEEVMQLRKRLQEVAGVIFRDSA